MALAARASSAQTRTTRSSTSAAPPIKFEPQRSAGPAIVIPFPIARRLAFIARAAVMPHRYQHSLIDKHAARLHRLGVDRDRVAADVRELEHALGMSGAASW